MGKEGNCQTGGRKSGSPNHWDPKLDKELQRSDQFLKNSRKRKEAHRNYFLLFPVCDSFPWLALSACHSSLPKSSLHSSSSQAPAWPGQSAFTDTHKQPLPSQRAHLLLPAHLCFPLGGGSQPKPVPGWTWASFSRKALNPALAGSFPPQFTQAQGSLF